MLYILPPLIRSVVEKYSDILLVLLVAFSSSWSFYPLFFFTFLIDDSVRVFEKGILWYEFVSRATTIFTIQSRSLHVVALVCEVWIRIWTLPKTIESLYILYPLPYYSTTHPILGFMSLPNSQYVRPIYVAFSSCFNDFIPILLRMFLFFIYFLPSLFLLLLFFSCQTLLNFAISIIPSHTCRSYIILFCNFLFIYGYFYL